MSSLMKAQLEQEGSSSSGSYPRMMLPHQGGQTRFFQRMLGEEPAKIMWFRGGIGSGKTYCGATWFCERIRLDPEAPALVTANDYGQLEASTLVALAEYCRDFDIPHSPSRESKESTAALWASRRRCTIYGSEVLILTSTRFEGKKQAGRGTQFRTIWFDEGAYADEEVFNTLIGRFGRGTETIAPQFAITSSINKHNPFNWIYKKFDDPKRDEKAKKRFESIKVSTRENPSNGPDYIEQLRDTYHPKLFALEVEGEYVVLTTGKIFGLFDRKIHTIEGPVADRLFASDARYPLHISFDFNVDPICAIAVQQRGEELLVLREWYMNDCSFPDRDIGQTVASWLLQQQYRGRIQVHGDASGKNRSANSPFSHWDIIFDELQKANLDAKRCFPEANPNVPNTVNAVQNHFHRMLLVLHGDRCPELVTDLEVLAWKDNDIDKSDGRRSHLADCLRYLVWDLFPIKRPIPNKVPQERKAIEGLVS